MILPSCLRILDTVANYTESDAGPIPDRRMLYLQFKFTFWDIRCCVLNGGL